MVVCGITPLQMLCWKQSIAGSENDSQGESFITLFYYFITLFLHEYRKWFFTSTSRDRYRSLKLKPTHYRFRYRI